jgi:hypothetical protein
MSDARATAAWVCAAFISGCGGFGGLGGDDGGSFTLATSSVSFSARADTVTPPEGQTVEATARGGVVYLDLSFDSGPRSPIGDASLGTSLLSDTARIMIGPRSATALGAGVFTGTVTGTSLAEQIEYGNEGWATITSTGAGIATTTAAYEFRTQKVLDGSARRYFAGRLGAAQDGNRMVIASRGGTGEQPVRYIVASGATSDTPLLRNVESLASDRTGNRLVFVGVAATEVFDRSFALLGNPPASTAAVLTPNRQRAYTYDLGRSIRAFDLTATLSSASSIFPEIGLPTALADSPGAGVVMTISPDSNTLFLGGAQRVLIVPAP